MTTFEALLLGIIQGVTEFLPISSSGHLELAQNLMGLSDLHNYIIFDLVCHLGTLFAIFLMFKQEIISSFTNNRTRFNQIVLGTLPLFPLVLILKPIKALFDKPEFLGYFFLLTSLILYVGIRFSNSRSSESLERTKWRDSLAIGLFQAVAILPGVSRSGSTISAARLLGWSSQEAVTFSFLLAIPATLGGVTIELLQLFTKSQPLPAVELSHYFIGLSSSFAVGYFALSLLRLLATKQKFMYFVWYCLILGIFSIFYFS